jgi:hypothetical protein
LEVVQVTVHESTGRRDWNWDTDGALEGLYVETRQVTVRSGPSAGQSKLIFDFHVGTDAEEVSVWETTVLRSKFREELQRRGEPDFEPGERIRITPQGWQKGPRGSYLDFDVSFEHAAPKKTTAELLGVHESDVDEPAQPDDDIPFG